MAIDLLLRNAHVATPAGVVETDVAVRDGKIAGLGAFPAGAAVEIDCRGLHVLPGVIDTQVHFREPGNTHKEDLATGTLSAIAGGVTAVFEMPNTSPLTVTAAALEDKMRRAAGRAFCDYAFFMGGCAENAGNLAALETLPGCCGVKVFMGSSTGALLAAADETVLSILKNGRRRVAVHAEDEARLKERRPLAETGGVSSHPLWRDAESAFLATRRLIALARAAGRHVHVLHVTTAEEISFLSAHKDLASVEVTPQHLTLAAPECYARLGTRAQMNPPIRDAHHRAALLKAVQDGIVDVVGSDHAPHTVEEKSRAYPASPSGMPGVQTLVPLMLDQVNAGHFSLMRLVDLLCHGPQRLYGLAGKGRIAAGYDADFTVVDLKSRWTVTDRWIRSKCGWTPFDGMKLTGRVAGTVLRGRVAMWEDEILGPPAGRPLSFIEDINKAPPPYPGAVP